MRSCLATFQRFIRQSKSVSTVPRPAGHGVLQLRLSVPSYSSSDTTPELML
jgi:hypothetical protein